MALTTGGRPGYSASNKRRVIDEIRSPNTWHRMSIGHPVGDHPKNGGGPSLDLLGVDTRPSHLVLGANPLLLIALFLRTQEPVEKFGFGKFIALAAGMGRITQEISWQEGNDD
jgi:hypothetical protein